MQFTIRHLLWFTMLAAVGSWWWLPSANDAKLHQYAANGWNSVSWLRRFHSLDTLKSAFGEDFPIETEVDFTHCDVILISSTPNGNRAAPTTDKLVTLYSRGRGLIVGIVPPLTIIDFPELISVGKNAYAFQVTETQFNLIDIGVAAGLLMLTFGSLIVGRRRHGLQTNSRRWLPKPILVPDWLAWSILLSMIVIFAIAVLSLYV